MSSPTDVQPPSRRTHATVIQVSPGPPTSALGRPHADVQSADPPNCGTPGRGWTTPMRLARNVSTAAVASIAAWSSWSHMVHLALKYGERPEVAYVLPISVDGMLVVASAAMVEDKRAGRNVRWSARIAFVAGMAASVAANIAAASPSVGARIVAAWPAIALLLVVEILARARPSVTATITSGNDTTSHDPPVQPLATKQPGAAPDSPGPTSPVRQRLRTRGSAEVRRRQTPTADLVARVRADHPDATYAEIAAEAKVSERHVRRLLKSGRDGESVKL